MHEAIERKFPSFFDNFTLPIGKSDISITAYRACPTDKIEAASFLPTYMEGVKADLDMADPGTYSLSVSEKPKDIKRFAVMNKAFGKPLRIAKGTTAPCCGPVQRTRDRTGDKRDGSHIDWWLYDKALPHEHFTIIDDFERYYSEYQKEAPV